MKLVTPLFRLIISLAVCVACFINSNWIAGIGWAIVVIYDGENIYSITQKNSK
ncbi:MAG: hypothetical protein ABIQ88_02270 [Chitinophagaceae bacterium]